MAQPPMITLSNGVEMPQLGFGVFQVPADEVYEPVTLALEAGYRLVDTAAAYRNEEGVGKAIANSGIARDELFVTTKLWNADHGFSRALAAFERSAERLGLDVVDLYLIHWPLPVQDDYVETWRALEQLYHDGRVRAIGLSNFTEQQIRRCGPRPRWSPCSTRWSCTPVSPGTAALLPHGRGHRHRGVVAARPGRDPRRRGHHPDRRRARPHAGPGGAALAYRVGQHRDPEVGDARAHRGEHRGLRLRARCRRDRRHHRHRLGPPPGTRPRAVRPRGEIQ